MPNIHLTSENTRSDAADLGVIANTIRAAIAQVGNFGLLCFHHSNTPSVNALMSVRSNPAGKWQQPADS